MKYIKRYAYTFFLGAALGWLGAPFYSWKFWAVMVPANILIGLATHQARQDATADAVGFIRSGRVPARETGITTVR